ncbi:MAG: glutathione S-transferase family protein [Pseudomonadota bacterium]
MVQLLESEIQTTEVLGWQGLHLMHHPGSSCSQKLRIYLATKGLDWTSHIVDIPAGKNYEPWYLGINPRGLVPTLVHDGTVIIESNDILEYIEAAFPEPAMIPKDMTDQALHALVEEDNLHLDLRALSGRYLFPSEAGKKPPQAMEAYASTGSATVGGKVDAHKAVEIAYFEEIRANDGVSIDRARAAVTKFNAAFDRIEAQLAQTPFVMGDALSVLDIAWYVYCARLHGCGYPIAETWPHLGAWFAQLHARPEFQREVMIPPPLRDIAAKRQAEWADAGEALSQLVPEIAASAA